MKGAGRPIRRRAFLEAAAAAGGAPRAEEAAGVLSVSVPAVRDHEVVAIDL